MLHRSFFVSLLSLVMLLCYAVASIVSVYVCFSSSLSVVCDSVVHVLLSCIGFSMLKEMYPLFPAIISIILYGFVYRSLWL